MKFKVTVVGGGNVGATTAQRIFEKGYSDVVLIDIVEDMPQGKSLDMLESGPILGTDANVIGSNSYDESENSDVVVITAGIARKPGMSRDDLLLTNMKIVGSVTEEISKRSPNAILLVVSNPLDAMVQHAYKVSGFPKHRVIGMAGILDTARFRTFLSQELNVSVTNISAYVLGGHGDTMVPIIRYATVAGIPVPELIKLKWSTTKKINAIIDRTRDGGGEIGRLMKTASAFYAPASSAIAMAESFLKDQKRVLPCAAYLNGQYGVNGLYVGVPVIIGKKGVEKILELKLNSDEKKQFNNSVKAVKNLTALAKKLTSK